MPEKPDQSAQAGRSIDYKAKYEELYSACGAANAKKRTLLTTISRNVGALLKIICEPDPPGCSGRIPTQNLEDLLLQVQQANALKRQQLKAIDDEIDNLMQQICDPNPPGCV